MMRVGDGRLSYDELADLVVAQARQIEQLRVFDDGLAHRALHEPEHARRHWQRAREILDVLGVDTTEDEEATTTKIHAHLAELDSPPDA